MIEGSESCLPLSFCRGIAHRKYRRWILDDLSSTSACPRLLSFDDGLESVVSYNKLFPLAVLPDEKRKNTKKFLETKFTDRLYS